MERSGGVPFPSRSDRRPSSPTAAAMKPSDAVSRDPNVMSGMLVFAGTRVPVDTLIEHPAAGDSFDDFPTVRREQAVAYLEMALEKTKESDARAA